MVKQSFGLRHDVSGKIIWYCMFPKYNATSLQLSELLAKPLLQSVSDYFRQRQNSLLLKSSPHQLHTDMCTIIDIRVIYTTLVDSYQV
jgi:hypothetical protein